MKLFITALIVTIIGAHVIAQESINTSLIEVKPNYSNSWQVYTNHSDVKVEYKFSECDFNSGLDKELLIFKVTNKTSEEITLTWHIELYYGGSCNTCAYPSEYTRQVTIPANGEVEGTCTPYTNEPLNVFSKFIDPNYTKGSEALHKFKLGNLTIN